MKQVGWFLGAATLLITILILTLIVLQLPVGDSLKLLVEGSFGDKFAVARSFSKMTPLVFTGLGMAVAWHARMYNIGGEGQYIAGGLCAAALATVLPASMGWFGATLLTIVSAAGGAGLAYVSAWLYQKRGVQVVISTILLNFIALQFLSWLVAGPLQRARRDIPSTERLPDGFRYAKFDPQTDLHVGILIAGICVFLVWFFLFRTWSGFRTRVAGANEHAAHANRLSPQKHQTLALCLSGALCGLAAASEFLGSAGSIDKGFSQNWGFLGIPVALLGGLNPLGIAASSLYFGALLASSENLGRFTQGGANFVAIVQAVAVLAVVAFNSIRSSRAAQQVIRD